MAQSKVLEFLQKRALSISFPGCKHATYLIIAKCRCQNTESRRQQLIQIQMVMSLGPIAPWSPLDPLLLHLSVTLKECRQ